MALQGRVVEVLLGDTTVRPCEERGNRRHRHHHSPDEEHEGDTARLPYGTKSVDTVARYAVQAVLMGVWLRWKALARSPH